MQPTKDGPDFAEKFCLVLITAQPSSLVTDVVLEVLIADEFLDPILKHDVLLCGVADILVILAVFALISFGAVSSQWVWPLEDAYLLDCQ